MTRQRIVVATADTVGERMAGPAIRAWQIAQSLAKEHEVRLVTTGEALVPGAGFDVMSAGDDELRRAVDWCDIFVFQGWVLAGRPFIPDSDKVLVADVYDPMHLEQLEQGRDAGEDGWRAAVAGATGVLNEQLLRADFFLCASEKQREFWLGHLASLGRVNVRTYTADESLRGLIDVVPFGVDDEPPVRTGPGPKTVVPGIGADAELLLWGGGVYNWFDPGVLIEAVDRLRHQRPRLRLLFMGMQHPNPEIPTMRVAVEARRLASGLGLVGEHVFFNEGWVPYAQRQNYLLDADIGVSTHLDHLETAFSFRTRVLDYLWAGLPVLSTAGDAMSELIERHGAGLVVPPGDIDAVAEAIDRLLGDADFRRAAREGAGRLATELRWSAALEPLLEFANNPRRAPDLLDPFLGPDLERVRKGHTIERVGGWRGELRTAAAHWRRGGVLQVVGRALGRIRRTVPQFLSKLRRSDA